MTHEPRVVSFIIDKPFPEALHTLRGALTREGLSIPSEVNTSERLRAELGVGVKESAILYVDTPILLLEAALLTPAGCLYVPEPVAISSSGKHSTAVVRSIKPILDQRLPFSVRDAILTLHERILRAIQKVGHPESVFQLAEDSHSLSA
ncbi:MAG: hypothetical protein IRZ15_01990 [Bryobacteraceae bacterium]|nr:hypothetical protein [Bryobacteraceae bacterium]